MAYLNSPCDLSKQSNMSDNNEMQTNLELAMANNENTEEVEAVFAQLEADRQSGDLVKKVLENGRYGIDPENPELICEYGETGKRIAVGYYENRVFVRTKTL
jgi:hypothetical protein